jgi:hypothetical protein
LEHRCSDRIATTLPVVVRTARGERIPGTIRNLSGCGAFLAVRADCSLLRGFIEIEVRLPYEKPVPCRWRAYVVHHQADGVGVLLDERHLGDVLPFLCATLAGAPDKKPSGVATGSGGKKPGCRPEG